MTTILLIDHNSDYREGLKGTLEQQGLEVLEADCPDTAFALLQNADPPDMIVCDLYMPFSTGENANEYVTSHEVGLKTMQELAWVYPDATVIGLAAVCSHELQRLKPYLEPIPAYTKPAELDDAADLVQAFLLSREAGGMH